MGMKIVEGSFADLRAHVRQTCKVAKSEVLRAMRKESKIILEIAQMNAPVDLHNLEDAIKMEEIKVGRERTFIEISVGGFVNGRNVDEYAAIMHEGSYNLGPISARKALSLNRMVGRKFLERALEEHEQTLIAKSIQAGMDAT